MSFQGRLCCRILPLENDKNRFLFCAIRNAFLPQIFPPSRFKALHNEPRHVVGIEIEHI